MKKPQAGARAEPLLPVPIKPSGSGRALGMAVAEQLRRRVLRAVERAS
jgi:hypothetical protein